MYKPHRPPPPPPCGDRVLLQKIVLHERRVIPCLRTELELTGMPCCAVPPWKVTHVQASGAQPWWTPLEGCGHCGQVPVRITLPVSVQVCDSCGHTHAASALVEAETQLPHALCNAEGCGQTLLILPCVRFLCASPCECGCVQAQLHVTLDVYLLRAEPYQLRHPAPACPELPLYPPPISPCCR